MAAILGAERGKSQIKKCGKNLLRFFTALKIDIFPLELKER
ncbi:hypothetical protein CGSHi22121_01052 [Haemophilus influenzae 22.1-21]|uniref:Uncharacterized protein n=1 Tax=Haemophilus influenzae 22.4-21 TaxID=375063 RepID=A4P062_HAEIF|nr:hypothetical protein HifGL_000377 [Haemophilus influenzae KR494]EDJ87875.1 hypothetical protein CGSHi22121_01052 [Haemophilus influenzae 22.1-21]EDK13204.1 hypothetical protein CGSHiR3021_02728 [Haemophilus influenzae 22.4-21]